MRSRLLLLTVLALTPPATAQDDAPLVVRLPLASRGDGPADTLFVRRDPADTGLDFVHRWRPEESYLHVLGNAMAGGGVAVGDADGDGLPEVVLTRPAGGTRLYRNLGDLRFEDDTLRAGLVPDAWGGGATFGDLDGDGDLDLAVCGYDTPNRVYWNGGDGRFDEGAAAAGLAFTGASVQLALADHDLDGDLDGYLLTNRYATGEDPDRPVPYENGRIVLPDELAESFDVLTRPDGQTVLVSAGQFDHLYRNEGDRSFSDVSAAAGIEGNHYGLSATWWDPDLDGWPDLYVANDFFGPDKLYSNRRDGSFVDVAPEALPHTPWFSMGADAADFDNDGLIDLFGSDMSGTTHERRQVTMTDLAEGGWFLEAAVPRQYMRNALYLNTGTGRFAELAMAAGVARSDWTWSTVFGDLDADGWQDLFISNGMTGDFFHYDRRAEAAAFDDPMVDYWAQQPPLTEANIAFRNRGDLTFEDAAPAWGLDHVAATFGAMLVDLDRDGDLDVIGNDYEGPAPLFENRSAEGHVLAVELRAVVGGDAQGDADDAANGGAGAGGGGAARGVTAGATDSTNTHGVGARLTLHTRGPDGTTRRLVRELFPSRGYMAGAEPRVHFGLGDHAVIERLTIDWPGGGRQRVTGLEVDAAYRVTQSADATARDAAPAGSDARTPAADEALAPRSLFRAVDGPVIPETPYDEFARQPLLPSRLAGLGPPLACGDVDADGDDDLYVGGPAGRPGQLLLVERGNLTPADVPAFANDDYFEDACALFVDADRDGDLDLYVASGGVEGKAGSSVFRDRLYLNDGAGAFRKASRKLMPRDTVSEGALAAGDLDGDGDLDLFLGSRTIPGQWPWSDAPRLLRNEDDGGFSDATADWAPPMLHAGPDAMAAARAGEGDGDRPVYPANSGVTSALVADVDDDGEPELLVGHEWGRVILHDRIDGTLQFAGAASGSGWWTSLSAGDPDHDGDLDVLAGNLGLGSRTRPGVSSIHWGDLDDSGVSIIAEVAHEGDREVPVRTRADVMQVRPFLGEDLPTYADYARASAAAVFGPFASELSEVPGIDLPLISAIPPLWASQAHTVLLRNTGRPLGERFVEEPLPAITQIAPVFGSAFVELDGDGHPDLLLAQNSFAPQPEHGRLDGGLGLALRGDGAGAFEALRADASGVVVPGDGKALVLADLDGDAWPDAVVSQNDGPLRFLLRDDPPADRILAVRLVGPPGNPTAVGARLTFVQEGGGDSGRRPTQTAEITAGSGYRSQSSPVRWFGREAGRAGTLTVRWPDGSSSTHAVARDAVRLTLRQP